MSENNKSLTTAENPQDVLMAVIESGPEILLANQELSEKTRKSVENLLAEIEKDGMTDELDAFCNKIQVRIKEVHEEMKASRMPLTRSMDKIVSSFTSMEAIVDPGKPDSLFNKIGKHRNAYATKKAEEQKRREEEARRKLAADQERNRLIGEADQQLRSGFIRILTDYKQSLQDMVNRVTLENYDSTWDAVHEWSSEFFQDDFYRIEMNLRGIYLQPEELVQIKANAREGKFQTWSAEFRSEVERLKQESLDKLPGMRKYLQEVRDKEIEQKRLEEEARIKREEAQKIADAAERERQLAEAKRKEEEAERQRIENARLEEERRKKEEEDRIKLEEEAKQKEEESKRKIESETDIRNAGTLFDSQVELASADQGAKAIESFEIEVKSPAGLLHIVSHYFTYKGNQEEVADLLKRDLSQMKKFCETDYKKNARKIDSPLVEYNPVYKVRATK